MLWGRVEDRAMHRFITLALALLAVSPSSPTRAEVLVGVAAAMTGRLAWIGEQAQRGAEMAVADINAGGGVIGQQVRIIAADDFCDPDQALAAARKLVGDGVRLVVGHFCSGASIPASKVYEEAGVLQISPGSTSPLLTEQGRSNVFRVIGRDDAQGVVAGNYLADHWSGKKIAILHDGTTYGAGLAEETRKQLIRRGATASLYKQYAPGKSEYFAEIGELRAADIAAVYVGGYHAEVALMVRTARDQAYAAQFISGDAMATEEFTLLAGSAAEGTLFTFGPDPRRNPEAKDVVERFRAEGFEPSGYTLLSYGAVQAWSQAVQRAASLDTPKVIASLHDHRFETVLGQIAFDPKGDLTQQSWVWYVFKGNEYVPLE
jgi:branched-chain amino acid transport system substrate-binding protein